MLDIQRISKTFNPGTVNEKKAITDLSLHLNKGEFVTVIGSNGASKSTLFNAIAGSFYVDDGAITVGGLIPADAVFKVEVTNNTSSPMDITCSYPYEIVALNSKNQKYTPIKNLYQVEGNPECNAQLQPGLTSTVTYPFQVPLDAKMVAIAFRDVGDVYSGTGGEDNYSYIVTDPNYVVNR